MFCIETKREWLDASITTLSCSAPGPGWRFSVTSICLLACTCKWVPRHTHTEARTQSVARNSSVRKPGSVSHFDREVRVIGSAWGELNKPNRSAHRWMSLFSYFRKHLGVAVEVMDCLVNLPRGWWVHPQPPGVPPALSSSWVRHLMTSLVFITSNLDDLTSALLLAFVSCPCG